MIVLPAALLATIAFFVAVAPITSFVTAMSGVANTSANIVNDVKNWEHPAAAKVVQPPPPAAKPAPKPVVKKKHHHRKPVVVVVTPSIPPEVTDKLARDLTALQHEIEGYEQPPWPTEKRPAVVVEAPHHDTLDWQLRLKRLFGLLLVVGAAFVIGHGFKKAYRIWKEETK